MTEMLRIARADIELVGEANGSGPGVLLLHAGGETRAVWRPIMTSLAERGFRSMAFDQRGHGESGGSPFDGVNAYGDDAGAMLQLMRRPLVVGASLGGFALTLALQSLEDEVAGLVLVDVTPSPDPDRTRAYLTPRGSLGASPLVPEILGKADHLEQITANLRLPIMLVCGGARSPLDSMDRARFAALVPHARIEIIDNASHLVARDAPGELAELIANFCGSAAVAARRRG